ncbi:MAG: Hsp70 family protein [Methyloligellaceae bacterium]
MNKSSFCGIDFGTSNSTVGICKNGKVSLAPVEKSHTTIPSAVFFDYEELITLYGREAVADLY